MKTHTKRPLHFKECLSELNDRLDRVEKSVDDFEDELEKLWDLAVEASCVVDAKKSKSPVRV